MLLGVAEAASGDCLQPLGQDRLDGDAAALRVDLIGGALTVGEDYA